MVASGKNMLSHGPVTINLTDLEQKFAQSGAAVGISARAGGKDGMRTFEDVIAEEGGHFGKLLEKIKGAYEEFV